MSYARKKTLKLPQQGQRWLDVKAAAAHATCSVQTIRRLVHSQQLRAITSLGHLVIDRNDLDELLLRNKKILPPYRIGTRPAVKARHERERQAA